MASSIHFSGMILGSSRNEERQSENIIVCKIDVITLGTLLIRAAPAWRGESPEHIGPNKHD
jgi:hypothetical protein